MMYSSHQIQVFCLLLLATLFPVAVQQQQLWVNSRASRAINEMADQQQEEKIATNVDTVTGNATSQRDVILINNGCVYHNDYISERDGPARQATPAEKEQMEAYMRQMEVYQEQFERRMSEQMRRMFSRFFGGGANSSETSSSVADDDWDSPGGSLFQMPVFPCFCDSCKQTQQGSNSTLVHL